MKSLPSFLNDTIHTLQLIEETNDKISSGDISLEGVGLISLDLESSDQALLEKILLWKRFIDDVLMLFRGTREECMELVDWLNTLMPGTIKFKFEFSNEKVNFLDLEIYIEDGRLMSDLYVKPTNSQLFLDYGSNHPQHCKKAIPYSQALRVVERCSTTENRDNHLANLKNKFEERHYPTDLINEQFGRAKQEERKT